MSERFPLYKDTSDPHGHRKSAVGAALELICAAVSSPNEKNDLSSEMKNISAYADHIQAALKEHGSAS